MRPFRSVALLLLLQLGGLAWFQFGQPLTVKTLARHAVDAFDPRPTHRILMLGNSRTTFNDMPAMLRAMADSAGDPQRLDITVDAPPGASFETLWGDAATQALLREHWDNVVLQPESRAQSSVELRRSFHAFGARLVSAAHPSSGPPELVVNWTYGPELWDGGDPGGLGRRAQCAAIQSDSEALAQRTGAKLVNVGRTWQAVTVDHPEIAMTEDGNHPTLAGSYLLALMLYSELTGHDAAKVTYVPDGLSATTAEILKQQALDRSEIVISQPDATA